MTRHPARAPRRLALRVAHVVRRAVAPAALELADQVTALRTDVAMLRGDLADAHAQVAELREELSASRHRLDRAEEQARSAEARAAGLGEEAAVLRDGLHESRRLNLRTAELLDLVTEVVLPLHDREIDPGALAALRGDVR